MSVEKNCRHYLSRHLPNGDDWERCRLNVNESDPFGCPEGCVFFEGRRLDPAGWVQAPTVPMSNTALGLPPAIPDERPRRRLRKKKD